MTPTKEKFHPLYSWGPLFVRSFNGCRSAGFASAIESLGKAHELDSALQAHRFSPRLRGMRGCLLLFGLTIFASFAHAQEHQMMDRIMHPNMSLSNPAQDRKFVAVEGTSIDRKFVAKGFYSGAELSTKSFWGLRSFLSKIFGTEKYARQDAAANVKTNAETAFASTAFATHESALMHTSSQADKSSPVRDYADNRPFLAKGARQQQLSEQSHALTIDEVRELLNKSK